MVEADISAGFQDEEMTRCCGGFWFFEGYRGVGGGAGVCEPTPPPPQQNNQPPPQQLGRTFL